MSHSQHEDCSVVAVADDLFASDGEFAPSDDRDSLMHIFDSFGFLWVPVGSTRLVCFFNERFVLMR